MPRPVARAAAFQAAVFGMTGLPETRLKIADRFDATVPSYRTLGLPALKGLPSRHPRISSFFRQPWMTAPHPSHQCEAPATQVSTVPSVNDRQHRRQQADQALGALTLRTLGILRGFHGFARPVGGAPRSRCP